MELCMDNYDNFGYSNNYVCDDDEDDDDVECD